MITQINWYLHEKIPKIAGYSLKKKDKLSFLKGLKMHLKMNEEKIGVKSCTKKQLENS